MIDELKDAIEKSHHRLAHLIDKIEDEVESLADDSVELWHEAKPKLQELQASMVDAERSLQVKTEAARLQAHLAIMDAHDQWSYLSKPITELAKHARQKGKTGLQHAELKAHLAKMEARDFLNEKRGPISEEFEHAKEKLEQTSLKAIEELAKNLENVGSAWTNMS
jgi:hypothetical protein